MGETVMEKWVKLSLILQTYETILRQPNIILRLPSSANDKKNIGWNLIVNRFKPVTLQPTYPRLGFI